MPGKVWKYITEKLENEGACHFSLLDPDPLAMNTDTVVDLAKIAEKSGSDAIMIVQLKIIFTSVHEFQE